MGLIQKITSLFERLSGSVEFLVAFIVTVVAIALLYYFIMRFLSTNDSEQLIGAFVLLIIVSGCIILFNEGISNSIMLFVPVLFVLLVFIIYAVEIKRQIWNKKNIKLVEVKHSQGVVDEDKIRNCISEIIKALQDMAKNDMGALIVLSNGNVPTQILDSGVKITSDISSELIESIFFPKTPLHDGAMIIDGTNIVAAGCFLPLTQRDNIPKELGTRHRAGIGITENIDVVTIIVSEETGIISIAKQGKIIRYADVETLRKTLNEYYWKDLKFRN